MAIFLSYSRQDEPAVKVLVRGFEAARRQVWFDTHDLGAGDVWWDRILDNIRSSEVFVVAVSDASMQSRACMTELDYARALGKSLVPVQVGALRAVRANPLADLHMLVYRPDDANSGFEVLGAVDAAAAKGVGPLPDPLPPEPAIPYAYLQALGRQIDTAEVGPADQVKMVDQLSKALREETEDSVRREILAMLERMRTRPWVTLGIRRAIRALLIANAPDGPEEGDGAAQRVRGKPEQDPDEPDQAEASVAQADARALFEQRMEELREREQSRAAERGRVDVEQETVWLPPAPERPLWGGVSGSTTVDTEGWTSAVPSALRVEPPAHQPMPQPVPQLMPVSTKPRHPHGTGGMPVSPPNYWALSIVAFLLSILFGGIAMYFSYQVGQRYGAHDHDGAVRASRNAKVWAIVGIVVGGFFLLSVLAG